jgi:hypothetical protein
MMCGAILDSTRSDAGADCLGGSGGRLCENAERWNKSRRQWFRVAPHPRTESHMTRPRESNTGRQVQGSKAKQGPMKAKAPPHKRSQSAKRREAAKENESPERGGIRRTSDL